MFVGNETIAEFDAELAEAINAETRRQEEHIAVSYTHLRAHET